MPEEPKNIYETDAVREFVATMSSLSRRKYFVARQVLQDVGYLRAPEREKVAGEDNLYAITIHAPDNERVFYCYDDGATIFMLHAYAKKTAKIPLRDASLRNEVSAVEARYAALGLIEDFMRSAAGSRKLSAYRDKRRKRHRFVTAADMSSAPSENRRAQTRRFFAILFLSCESRMSTGGSHREAFARVV